MFRYRLVRELIESANHDILLHHSGHSKDLPEITIPDEIGRAHV